MKNEKPFGPPHYSQRQINAAKAVAFLAAVAVGVAIVVFAILVIYNRQ